MAFERIIVRHTGNIVSNDTGEACIVAALRLSPPFCWEIPTFAKCSANRGSPFCLVDFPHYIGVPVHMLESSFKALSLAVIGEKAQQAYLTSTALFGASRERRR